MELEEHEGVERPGERCEVCGAVLTSDEQRDVLTGGGPVMCKIHAAEQVPVADDETGFGDPAA